MAAVKRRFAPEIKNFLFEIGAGKSSLTYQPDDMVYAQGDTADAVFYLQKGKAKKTVTSKNGKEAVLALIEPGDFFGEGCLHGSQRRVTQITAVTECAVMRLEKSTAVRMLHNDPEFAELFINHMLRRNARAEEDLVDQLFNSSEKRLARMLLLLANYGKESKPEPVITKISQETLAEMIGTTRSRVSFFMNKFRRLGFIDYRGGNHGDLHVNTSLLNMVLLEGITGIKNKKK